MENELSITFIGGGRAAAALGGRQAGKVCAAGDVHVIDINQEAAAPRQGRSTTGAQACAGPLPQADSRLFAAATRNIQGVVAWTRQWLHGNAAMARVASAGGARGKAGGMRK